MGNRRIIFKNLRKFVFTNGSKEHVKNITTSLGIDDQFENVFDIVDAEYNPKPAAKGFDLMLEKFKIDPKETLYIEDIAKNLSIGKQRGTTTAWLIASYFGLSRDPKIIEDLIRPNILIPILC